MPSAEKERRESERKVKNAATNGRKESEIFTNDSLAKAVLGKTKPSCSREPPSSNTL